MPNTCHNSWHKPQRCAQGLAMNTSKLVACGSFWCQNGPPGNCRDDGWLALSGWPQARKVGPGGKAPHQLLCNLLGLVASILEPRNRYLAVLAAGASCYQCWPNKVLYWLAWFGASSRTGRPVGKREFCRWGLDVGVIGWLIRIDLIEWHLLVRTASNKEFEYCQPKAFPLYLCFFKKNKTLHLQPHLPCFDDNLFENDIVRVFAPIKLDENSGFLFPWSNQSSCDW